MAKYETVKWGGGRLIVIFRFGSIFPTHVYQKKGSHGKRKEDGEEIPRWPHENTIKLSSGRTEGGFKGFFSSVASLGRSKAGQADDGDDETKV